MVNDRNEELERLLDGGDDASSATLFGTAISGEYEKPMQKTSVEQAVAHPRAPGRSGNWIVLCVVTVIAGSIALIFSISHFALRPKPQATIAQKVQVPSVPLRGVPAAALAVKPVSPAPAPAPDIVDEKLDFTDEIKRLAARPIALESLAVTAPETSRQPSAKPVQKTSFVAATIKPKTSPAPVAVEKKDAIPTFVAAKAEPTQRASQVQPQTLTTPIEYVVGDKLPSGETILSVSKNGDVVTDMRIIKKGQN